MKSIGPALLAAVLAVVVAASPVFAGEIAMDVAEHGDSHLPAEIAETFAESEVDECERGTRKHNPIGVLAFSTAE